MYLISNQISRGSSCDIRVATYIAWSANYNGSVFDIPANFPGMSHQEPHPLPANFPEISYQEPPTFLLSPHRSLSHFSHLIADYTHLQSDINSICSCMQWKFNLAKCKLMFITRRRANSLIAPATTVPEWDCIGQSIQLQILESNTYLWSSMVNTH